MKQALLQKIENSKSPDFGNILSKSFDLFQKVWLDSFLHLMVTFLLAIPVLILVYLPFVPVIIESVQNGNIDFQPNFDYSLISIAGYVVLFVALMVLTQVIAIAITAHFFKVCKIKDLNTNEEVGGYLSFLNGANFIKLILLSLATLGIAVAALMLCYIPILYVMVPLQLIVVIFAFNEQLSVKDIITVSFKLGNKFWLLVFGLIVVSSMIAQLGVILCFVGVFFTAYFTHIPIYYFYKYTIGFGDDKQSVSDEFSTQYLN